MNILIAPDSFKESLSAIEVCRAIHAGFLPHFPNAHYQQLPMADGGDGTLQVLAHTLGGRVHHVWVHDPLMRRHRASYLMLPQATAVIEIAEACGLHLLARDERSPMLTTSFGVGELIKEALDQGARRIIIGLGGSATNDAGTGMLRALGMRFFDNKGETLAQGGGALGQLHHIDTSNFDKRVLDVRIDVACDVTNPLYGPYGASHVFAPQKGGTPAQIQQLDHALRHFARISRDAPLSINDRHNSHSSSAPYRSMAGAGAAGGLGFGLMAFCGARLTPGFDIIARLLELSQCIAHADLIITGEGQLDHQTGMGKVADGIHNLARAQGKPVIAICGSVNMDHSHANAAAETTVALRSHTDFDVVMPSIQTLGDADAVFTAAFYNVKTTAYNIAAAMRLGQQMP